MILTALVLLPGCFQLQRETIEEEAEHNNSTETFTHQARLGERLFQDNCQKCHGQQGQGTEKGPRVIGLKAGALSLDPPAGAQKRNMKFRTVSDIAHFVIMKMPADEPGKLSADDYFRILAFDLRENGIDLGDQHLDMGVAAKTELPWRDGDAVSAR